MQCIWAARDVKGVKKIVVSNAAISFGERYLATPNIGIQGSRGVAAIPLLVILIAWGKEGLVNHIDHTMSMVSKLAIKLKNEDKMTLWAMPATGITIFRPTSMNIDKFYKRLPEGIFSSCIINNEKWIRSVAANPLAHINDIISAVQRTIH